MVVGEERNSSGGRVGVAVVLRKSARANCGIGIPRVEGQRSSTDTGIEAGVCAAKERIPTNCRFRRAGCEAKKGVLPSAVLNWDSPVWRRDHCLRSWQKADAEIPISM